MTSYWPQRITAVTRLTLGTITREHVPVLVSGPRYCSVELGERQGFSDMGQTLAAHVGLSPLNYGASFLKQITLESPV